MIVNVADASQDRWVDSTQTPCFYLGDGTAVFEVWFWHRKISRWFVMTTADAQAFVKQGVVAFWPGDIAGLKKAIDASTGHTV